MDIFCRNRNAVRDEKGRILGMRPRTAEEIVQRVLVMAVRNKRTGCLISRLRKDGKGYARTSCGGHEVRAHVVVFFKGKLPPAGQRPHVLHTCDNRACVEEDHLYAGTNKHNIADKVRRDRSGKKLNIAKATRIMKMAMRGRLTQRQIAKRFGVTQQTVSRIKTGVRWTHLHTSRGPDSVASLPLESGA